MRVKARVRVRVEDRIVLGGHLPKLGGGFFWFPSLVWSPC